MKRIWKLLLTATIAAGACAQTYSIRPFVTCIVPDPTTGTYDAYLGYESTEQAIVQVMVGNDNRFVPNPANRGQPTLFLPGYFEKAFRATLDATQITQWVFLGQAVTLSLDLPICASATNLLFLPPATVSVPYSQRLSAVTGRSNVSWTASTTLPAGLGLSPAGVISGTPQTAGTYFVNVQASDGVSTSQQTYRLQIANGVIISDAASTRAPGFTPQFRVVTNVASTTSATAACDTTEFVVTGGGSCTVPNSNTAQGRIASSGPAANGWTLTCSGGLATAVAVCSRY